MDRQTATVLGGVFLLGMVITLILAIWTFEGTPTVLLLVTSLVFLGVSLFFFSGGGQPSEGAGEEGLSQQQSVVLGGQGGPATVEQSSSTVYAVCSACGERVQDSVEFCPSCGEAMGA